MLEFLPGASAFTAGSALLAWLSRKPLARPGSHGFYRFFAWEGILGLVVLNRWAWGNDPLAPHQMLSWLLMLASIWLAVQGIVTLRRHGRSSAERPDHGMYEWEKTGQLVTAGIFAYIRHPMYASLLALAWGAYFQNPSWAGSVIAALASFCLWLTARTDERECLAYFGQPYADYMRHTKRFLPGVF